MSTYYVVKRINEDRVYMPGEMVVDPPWAAILMDRGFLVPVPSDFVPPTKDEPIEAEPEPEQIEPGEPVEVEPEDHGPIEPASLATDEASTANAKLPKVLDLSGVVPEPTPADPET